MKKLLALLVAMMMLLSVSLASAEGLTANQETETVTGGILSNLGSWWNTVKEKTEETAKELQEKAEEVVKTVQDKAGEIANALQEKAVDIQENAGKAIKDVVETVGQKANEIKESLPEEAAGIWNKLLQKLDQAKGLFHKQSATEGSTAADDVFMNLFGDFYFGMPYAEAKALGVEYILDEQDEENQLRRLVLFEADSRVIYYLWFAGLDGSAPLMEIERFLWAEADQVEWKDGKLDAQTTQDTVTAVYGALEEALEKEVGAGLDMAEDGLPLPSCAFASQEGALSQIRVRFLKDGNGMDVITHAISTEGCGLNVVIYQYIEADD